MSLVNRLSAFFLLALAVILAGYSSVLYVLVARHLHVRFDQQLHGALHQLAAAVEVEQDDVKFELSDHVIHLGTEEGLEDIRWAVFDEDGKLVAQSQNLLPATQRDSELLAYATQLRTSEHQSVELGDWRVLQQRLAAPQPKPKAERDVLEREALVVTAGRSSADLHDDLHQIALLVTLLPLGAWLIAAVAGRWYCAAALMPVRAMAAEARTMSELSRQGQFSTQRLPLAGSNDELMALGVAFNSLLDEMFKAMAQQRRFSGVAAHQLRTPLAALRGQIEVALRRPRTADEHAATLGVLLEQTTELQLMIEGLLFLARADGESAAPPTETISLGSWLPKQLERWREHPRASDLKFTCFQPAEVQASSALLGQLLENLLSNALKYSAAGTPIDIELRRESGQALIVVRDRGIGILPAERPFVFDPFYRSPAAKASGIAGTGLGLVIAARIANVSGGELLCTAIDGPGSRFVLVLPAV